MTGQQYSFSLDCQNRQRLDKFLVLQLPDYSRARLQVLIREGLVRVNGVQIVKPGFVLEPGAVVQIHIPASKPARLIAEQVPLDIVFENDDLIMVNKPAGMVVHPSLGHPNATLIQAALAHAPEIEGIGGEQRPGVVHRLDKDTSGLILLAKNDRSHRWLQEQFSNRKVTKIYYALVDRKPPTANGRIEAPIGRDEVFRKKMAIQTAAKGRESITEFITLEKFTNHTLLKIHPLTGRTHQIRVHLAFIHCPIVGDTQYGYKHPSIMLNRHFLHAAELAFLLPGESQERRFSVPLPQELEQVLQGLREGTV